MKSPESQLNSRQNLQDSHENLPELLETEVEENDSNSKGKGQAEFADAIKERAENLRNFQVTGDQQKDIENFLTITGRKNYLESIQSGKIDASNMLSTIKNFQLHSLDEELKMYHKLDKNDPGFIKKTQFFQEIPEQEIEIINKILGDETNDKQHEIQREALEYENLPENLEKQERMKQISEQVEQGFDFAKERMLALEQRFDEISSKSKEKLSKLSKFFPDIITLDSLNRIDQSGKKVKDAYARMFVLYDLSNDKMQSMFQLLQIEFLSEGQIDLIENSVDRIFETIDRGEEKIEEKLDRLESIVDRIPDIKEAIDKPEEVEKIEKEIGGNELFKENSEEEIAIEQ